MQAMLAKIPKGRFRQAFITRLVHELILERCLSPSFRDADDQAFCCDDLYAIHPEDPFCAPQMTIA